MKTISSNPKTIKELQRKWRGNSGHVKSSLTFAPGPVLDSFGLGVPVLYDPFIVQCSFCGIDTPRITASHGVGKPKKIKRLSVYVDTDGNRSIDEKISHTVPQLTACPKCVNQLPTLKFPETEG